MTLAEQLVMKGIVTNPEIYTIDGACHRRKEEKGHYNPKFCIGCRAEAECKKRNYIRK